MTRTGRVLTVVFTGLFRLLLAPYFAAPPLREFAVPSFVHEPPPMARQGYE